MRARHISLIIRTELRQRARVVSKDDQMLGYVIVGIPIVLLAMIGFAYVTYSAGRSGVDLDTHPVIIELLCAAIAAIGFVTIGLRTLQNIAGPTQPDGILSLTSHSNVVYAHLLLEWCFIFVIVGLPAIVGGIAYAVGVGSPGIVIFVIVVAASTTFLGTATGFVIGNAIRVVATRVHLVVQFKGVAIIVLSLVALAVLTVSELTAVVAVFLGLFQLTPIRWYGELMLLAIIPGVEPWQPIAAITSTGLTAILLLWASSWLTGRLWYTVPVTPDAPTESSAYFHLPLVDRQTNHVIVKTWKRARRAPIKLLYVGYGAAIVGIFVSNALRDWHVPVLIVFLTAFYGAWATGSAFTLNPLGEEWPVYQLTFTSPVAASQLLGGFWLAAALPGVVFTGAISATLALFSPLALHGIILAGIAGAGLAALAPGLATGIGVIFSKTTHIDLFHNRSAIVPSAGAFYAYSVALGMCTVPLWAALPNSSQQIAQTVGLDAALISWGAVGLSFLLLTGGAAASFRLATTRVEEFRLS